MPYPIDEAQATALVTLYPRLVQRSPEPVKLALQRLLDEEHARRGVPDATGALNPLALTQGGLLKEEFDLSTHAHHACWTLGALLVDVKGMIHVNALHGFPVGDALLKAVVASLHAQLPGCRVVRLQGDNFAALLVPTSGLQVTPALRASARERLQTDVRAALPAGATVPDFTLALLELTIEQPTHWQVLGPLVWGELERAYIVERLSPASEASPEPQRRRLQLHGFVPPREEP